MAGRPPKKEWTREMYMQLGNLIARKASPGEIAVRMGCEKKEVPYRLKVYREQSTILAWSEDELECLKESKSADEYLDKHEQYFGKHWEQGILLEHWKNREKYLAAWYREKNERAKQVHTVQMKSTKIQHVQNPDETNNRATSLVDEGEQLVKLNHKVAELTSVMKELLQVQKDAYAFLKQNGVTR
jgi:DNA repair ATPase RecN